jgi:hypothetical protein
MASATRQRDPNSEVTAELILKMWEKQDGKCFYTGLPMEVKAGKGKNNPAAFSIDRIDSSKGYTRDNVVLCRWDVNRAKNNYTLEHFKMLCKAVTEHMN